MCSVPSYLLSTDHPPKLDVDRSGFLSKDKLTLMVNVSAKYSVLLSAKQQVNGLMETKLLQAKQDQDSLTQATEGRMKSGIELSIAELNKLLPL